VGLKLQYYCCRLKGCRLQQSHHCGIETYGVSKRELMKEYDQAIETLRKPPDWLKRLQEWEAEGKFAMESEFSPSSEPPLQEVISPESGEEKKHEDRDEKEEITWAV
jgi:hypothetical protein